MPNPLGLWPISLEDFRANIALNPLDLKNKHTSATSRVTLRPVPVGGSASSSGGILGVQDPVKDYWVETEKQWIRMHVEPRHTMCYPLDIRDGPPEKDLKDARTTHLVFLGREDSGRRETRTHNWREERHSKERTRSKWTGRSIFYKVEKPSDTAMLETSGLPIPPGSTLSLRAGLAGLRTQMAEAQRRDPRLLEIVRFLRKEPAGSYLPAPRAQLGKVRRRALLYRLTSDHLLVARGEGEAHSEDLPVVPDATHLSEVPGAPRKMTWKHVFLGAVHNTATGQHRTAREMHDELSRLVSWYPPEDLLKNCVEWRERCKLCCSVHKRPRDEPAYKAVKSYRPFYRVQVDLMEVKPTGQEGERYVFTLICVCTRYIFLRALASREAPDVATLMLDILLDAGVIPAVIQSDNEFVNLAFEELCSLLGSTQIFSAVLRPQSQGIVERSHRDIRAQLAILVESLARSNPRRWPHYLKYVEYKLRHRTLATGVTPYAAVHGFFGSSALSTAMGAIEAIPEDVVWADWLRAIVSESKYIAETLSDHWVAEAALRARKHSESVKEAVFEPGELVLLTKPFYEKGLGVILPQADGPYLVSRVLSSHTVVLADPMSGEPLQGGRPLSMSRLIKFKFPADWAGPEAVEADEESGSVERYRRGMFLCVASPHSQNGRLHVARVEAIFAAQGQVEVSLYWVPPKGRTGPWQARVWTPWLDESSMPKKEVVSKHEIICQVELRDGALTQASLEKLTLHGVPATGQPRRDATLPPRA